MRYVITLIAPSQAPFAQAMDQLRASSIALGPVTGRDGRAIDIGTDTAPAKPVMDEIRSSHRIDIIWQEAAHRQKRLFLADMDATMVAEETLDELAAFAGIKDQIAAITRRAMNGELDFHAALRERVALLRDLPEDAMAKTADAMHYTPGGAQLLKALKAAGAYCVLVSGGFTYFTSRVANHLGFDENHGNTLLLEGGRLTGAVGEPILDKTFKQTCLIETAKRLGIPLEHTMAIGDGANDLPMLQTAGLGIGFESKTVLREALPNHLLYNGLDALVYVLGLPQIS